MSTISLNLPDSLHEKVMEMAERAGISTDEYIAAVLAERAASDAYLDARAKRSSKEAFEHALAQVPDVPPIPGDEI